MKSFLNLIILLSIGLNAQSLQGLSETIVKFDEALVKKDTTELDLILNDKVLVTHSNGLTENKSKMKENTASTFIKYNKIKQKNDAEFLKINENSYIVYRFITVQGVYDIYDFELELRLMEVWIWKENRWQLFGRQSLEIKSEN